MKDHTLIPPVTPLRSAPLHCQSPAAALTAPRRRLGGTATRSCNPPRLADASHLRSAPKRPSLVTMRCEGDRGYRGSQSGLGDFKQKMLRKGQKKS